MLPSAEAVLHRLTQAHGVHTAARVLDQLANSTGWLVDTTYASLVWPSSSLRTPEQPRPASSPVLCYMQCTQHRRKLAGAPARLGHCASRPAQRAIACCRCTGWACPHPSSSVAGGTWA